MKVTEFLKSGTWRSNQKVEKTIGVRGKGIQEKKKNNAKYNK